MIFSWRDYGTGMFGEKYPFLRLRFLPKSLTFSATAGEKSLLNDRGSQSARVIVQRIDLRKASTIN